MTDLVLSTVTDGIAVVTLNRPDKRNAMSDDMRDGLRRRPWNGRLRPIGAVRAVVLTGAGRAFCAGGDVAGMQQRMDADRPAAVGFNGWSAAAGRAPRADAAAHAAQADHRRRQWRRRRVRAPTRRLACDFVMASSQHEVRLVLHPARPDPGWRRTVFPAAPGRPGAGQGADLHRPHGRGGRSRADSGLVDRISAPETLLADAIEWAKHPVRRFGDGAGAGQERWSTNPTRSARRPGCSPAAARRRGSATPAPSIVSP